MDKCRHCKREMRLHTRGLCYTCYSKPGIRERYSKLKRKPDYTLRREPTMADIERLVAKQMKKLPRWWDKSFGKFGDGDD